MKFSAGSETDTNWCRALTHEFLRCHNAFLEFAKFATERVPKGADAQLSYQAQEAYSRFLTHLYEFMLAAYRRERFDTNAASGRKGYQHIEAYINHHAQRILTNRRTAIKNGTAPKWENSLSAYPERIPANLGESLRKWRNRSVHVGADRVQMDCSQFFHENHPYVYMLYRDSMYHWGPKPGALPDFQAITNFTV
jgi:hypothetical protein